MDHPTIIFFVLLFLLGGVILSLPSSMKKKKPKLGVFGYRLIYSDTRGWGGKNAVRSKLLKSEKDDVSGKPDYIYKHMLLNRLIPIELKSGEIKNETMPHKGDLLQLGAYFLIIEEVYGVRPGKGHLIYKDYMFIVRNTKRLRKDVRTTLGDMRRMLKDGEGTANASFVNCRHCVCRGTVCKEYTE
ncbi:MAG: hypothetical protein LBU77_01500 [Clostridiales bacterium]|jgi:CRISPR-associated exonuclease Cas4|nr:hypothetical protein [Clostridiales bacterium]